MSSSKQTDGSDRFACTHQGCGRSFARKEHLSRHELSHSDTRYVCSVCGREFTRRLGCFSLHSKNCIVNVLFSDSLHRHITKHGDAFKPTPSGRSKRACIACHASKIKCDGNVNCSRCVKKGVDCIYEQQDTAPQAKPSTTENLSQSQPYTDSPQPNPTVITTMSPQIQEPEVPMSSIPSYNIDITMSDVESNIPDSLAPESMDPRSTPETTTAENRLNWILNSRIEKDSGVPDSSRIQAEDLLAQPECDDFHNRCHTMYFLKFHHRWAILHRSTYSNYGFNVLSVTVMLIGAWLEGSGEAREYAINSHMRVMDEIFTKLVCYVRSKNYLLQLTLSQEPCLLKGRIQTVATYKSLPGSLAEHNIWNVLWSMKSISA